MKKILFTPLGLTDPISNFKDGAMLNICRYYDIDKVYLYISKEILGYHNHDNRYIYCINKLAEIKNRQIEYELIVREDLEDVHIFDSFIEEFRNILTQIHNNNPQYEIYVNVSSGTPAMKSALQIIAAFREFDIVPVQVSTPEKSSNPHAEDKLNYNPVEMWECNEDNDKPVNRCSVSKNINFLMQIRKQMLAELINKYDYKGALTLAETMSNSLNKEFLELLEGACSRSNLDCNRANTVFKKYGYDILEVEQSDKMATAEFLLYLDIKARKGELGDFVRAITPLLVDLFEKILHKQCKFRVEDYVRYANNIRKWNIEKLSENLPVKKALDEKYYGSGGFRGSDISSDHLLEIIDALSDNLQLRRLCNDLRNVEINVRNSAAHTIICVDDNVLIKRTGNTSKNLVDKLFALMKYTDIKVTNNFFNSYDNMNKIIICVLEKN